MTSPINITSGWEHLVQQYEEDLQAPILFATVAGSHAFGFPSPTSDYDVRGIHVLPLEKVVGLDPGQDTLRRIYSNPLNEVEFLTHDLIKYCRLILNHNGNVLEDVFSPIIVVTSPEHEELKSISSKCLTKHHANFYLGMSNQMIGRMDREGKLTLKMCLHLYRVLMAGIWLMNLGVIEGNLPTLAMHFSSPEISYATINEMISQRRYDPHYVLTNRERDYHRSRHGTLLSRLERSKEATELPGEPQGRGDMANFIQRVRFNNWSKNDV